MKRDQIVAPLGDKWIVKGEDNKKATRVVSTQKETIAIGFAIAMAQCSELTIRGRDGRI